MGFRCPNCGGSVIYDIPSGKMKCEHCKSMFDVLDFKLQDTKTRSTFAHDSSPYSDETSGNEEDGFLRDAGQGAGQEVDGRSTRKEDSAIGSGEGGFVRYVCTNCGAEIDSLDTDLVAYCQYCGGEVVLSDGNGRIPDRIIPFSVTKRQCIGRYKNFIRSCRFLPKEYKDPDFLKNFTGIYIPEWTYQTKYDGTIPFSFTANRTISYDYGEIIRGAGEASLGGYVEESKDASSRLDDTIADAILPANMTGMVPFHPGYMAGFYADVPDVPAKEYSDLVLSHAENIAVWKVKVAADRRAGGDASVKLDRNAMPTPSVSVDATLIPVWFLTWKKNGRVAYSVMNGQTGDCFADMPVSLGAFMKSSLILAAIIGAILLLITHFTLLTPDALLFFVIYLCLLSADLFRGEVKEIACRENHVYDRGYTGTVKMKPRKIERIRQKTQLGGKVMHFIWIAVMTLFMWFPLSSAIQTHVTDRGSIAVGVMIFWIAMIRKSIQIAMWASDTSKPIFGAAGFLMQLIPFVTYLLLGFEVQNDLPFYFLSMAALAALILQVVLLTRYYNLIATRPVPGFHTGRKGGSDGRA